MKTQLNFIFHILLFPALLVSLYATVLKVTPVEAASPIVVTTTTDEYDNVTIPGAGCSLREAITAAKNDSDFGGCTATTGTDTINLGAHTYDLTRGGIGEDLNVTGDLDISSALTIQGAGAQNTIIEAGTDNTNGIDRVVHITGAFTVNLHDLTIANGKCSCSGGGVWNGGTLTLNNSAVKDNTATGGLGGAINNEGTLNIGTSTFSGNSADFGGGLMNNSGTMTLVNSTVFDNHAGTQGGGLFINSGTATVINSTFSANEAGSGGGGIFNTATLNLANTILANSVAGSGGADCSNSGTIGTDDKNLIEANSDSPDNCGSPAVTTDPDLSALGYHGAVTENLALLADSPAINAGDDSVCDASPVDDSAQNGGLRPQGAHCDIGSYEVNASEGAPTFTVNNPADTYDGFCDTLGNGLVNKDCSLRDAITAANQNAGADTITVPAGTFLLSIAGSGEDLNATGDLDIRSDMTINGGGPDYTIVYSSGGIDRVFHITGAYTVNISGVSIDNGHPGSGNEGGGILNQGGILSITNSAFLDNYTFIGKGSGIQNTSGGALTINNSTFSGNTAAGGGYGGGVMNDNGTLTVTNSTFAGNTASFGGGLYNNLGTATVKNSTFSGNHLGTNGGGIDNNATLNLANTILANSTGGADCYMETGATLNTNVKNLIETNAAGVNACGTPSVAADPMLDSTLALNGGTTQNFALLAGSPALYAGDNATCAASPVNNTSQNGVTRPQGLMCDIGSYEKPVTKITTTFRSVGGSDGFVLESSEKSNVGGSVNSTATTFRLGDDAAKKQYRGLLSFGTGSIPDNTVISQVTLKLTKQGVVGGGNPVTTFQGFMLDMKKGFFGATALEKGDFQAAATHTYGPRSPSLVGGAYIFDLTSGASYINKAATNSGLTQIRVRFQKDDNNNAIANYLSLYSGNYPTASVRPALIVQYYVP